MKILRLNFLNLNSLKGEFTIDLTELPLSEAPIFAITGPTGAGKTTILDAICLALYGKTPRLENISQTTNEIMTRHTGECRSEVEFQVGNKVYRSRWEQRRAHGHSDGKLQAPQMSLADLNRPDGLIIAEKIKDVKDEVESLTGLDFARFTRSMMLAQGSFAAFLQSNDNERAELLEKMTGTDIYAKVSQLAFERSKSEKEKLAQFEAKLQGFQLLPDVELSQQKDIWQSCVDNESKLQSQKTSQETELNSLQKCVTLLTSLKAIGTATEALAIEKQKAEPDLQQLVIAEKAQLLEADFRECSSYQEQQLTRTGQLKSINQQLPELQKGADEGALNLATTQKRIATYNEEAKQYRETLKSVRAKDQDIKAQRDNLQLGHDTMTNLKTDKKLSSEELLKLQDKLILLGKEKQTLINFVTENSRLEELRAALTGLEERPKQLVTLQIQASKKSQKKAKLRDLYNQQKSNAESIIKQSQLERELLRKAEQVYQELALKFSEKKEENSVDNLETQIAGLRKNQVIFESAKEQAELIIKLSTELQEKDKSLTETIDEIAKVKKQLTELETTKQPVTEVVDLLKQNLQLEQKVQSFEAERGKLADQSPCPLCGSLEHPYAKGNLASLTETEKSLQEKTLLLEKLTTEEQQLKLQLVSFEAKRKSDQSVYNSEQARLNAMQLKWQSLCQQLQLELKPEDRDQLNQLIYQGESTVANLVKNLQVLKQLDSQLRKAEKELSRQQKATADLRLSEEKVTNQLKALKEQEESIDCELNQLQSASKGLQLQLDTELSIYNESTGNEPTALVGNLRQKVKFFTSKETRLNELKSQLDSIQVQIKAKEEALTLLAKREVQGVEYISKIQSAVDQLVQERQKLLGDRVPDTEEARLQQQFEQNEKLLQDSQQQSQTASQSLQSATANEKRLNEEIDVINSKLRPCRERLNQQLELSGFEDEQQLAKALRKPEVINQLRLLQKSLTERQTALNRDREKLHKELQVEESKTRSGLSVSELTEKLSETSELYKSLLQQKGAIKERLELQAKLVSSRKQLYEEQKKQQQECQRWGKLNELIGSADGRKFRRFAQGLTFDMMISLANTQLARLNTRYVLRRNPEEALGLQVLDTFQADTIRSTKNLSGGEQFLISLALALGLSQLAGRSNSGKVARIDSLFLDEGFGSLDQETLDVALAA